MRYTVIGLGQFGQELCTELSARNIEVVAVASTDEELEQIKDLVTYAVVTDYTNPAALRELELDDQSAVIVAIGDSFEENLLVVTHLQKMGVPLHLRPRHESGARTHFKPDERVCAHQLVPRGFQATR